MNAKARKLKRQRERDRSTDKRQDPTTSHPFKFAVRTSPLVAPENHHQHHPLIKSFLTSSDGSIYHDVLKQHYQGFVRIPAAEIPTRFHTNSKRVLEKLRDSHYYQYDMVMAGGKHLSRTFVKRTLVGDPGITYKYLGLRLFAHAWSGKLATPMFREVYTMNQEMIRCTKQQMKITGKTKGSCEYNLTLINYMEPSCDVELKNEEAYGMGKASVSWHADSGLQDYSSIGVYHTLPTQKAAKWDWKIALRKNNEDDDSQSNDVVPPAVVVPTEPGDLYFLLSDFNHTHQHMVLAGSETHRISSTHRVALTASDTYEYIKQRISHALQTLKAGLQNPNGPSIEVVQESQNTLTEVEFEWIAQYWVQGAQHDVMHVWWQAPMRALEEAWNALEKYTCRLFHFAITSSTTTESQNKSDLIMALRSAFQTRHEMRVRWDERRADKIYKRRIPRPFQPVDRPVFETASRKRLPKDLTDAIVKLTEALAQCPNPHDDIHPNPKNHDKPDNLTKQNKKQRKK
jgi:alpha-ketoglutarate-dependent dioxygenase FTO